MFPIHNDKGRVVGFGGRQSNAEHLDKSYKYINSKESLIFDKGSVLYGLFQSKQSIIKSGTAILTEGYTDVISMHQNGCDNTIASSGTALTERQAKLIKKYAAEIILFRDGDAAGLKATNRDLDICLSVGLNVSLCILPDGEDPDSFARFQKEKMPEWIQENKQDAVLWKTHNFDFKRDRYEFDVDSIKKATKIQVDTLRSNLQKLDVNFFTLFLQIFAHFVIIYAKLLINITLLNKLIQIITNYDIFMTDYDKL